MKKTKEISLCVRLTTEQELYSVRRSVKESFMVKVKVKEDALNEMALANISSLEDNLPFQIILQLPDHDPPHAHIRDNKDSKKSIAQILIPQTKPKSVDDIKLYKGTLSDADKMTIYAWMNRKNKRQAKYTNWEALKSLWGIASK